MTGDPISTLSARTFGPGPIDPARSCLVPECVAQRRACHDHCSCPEVRVPFEDAPRYYQEIAIRPLRGLIPNWHPDDYDPE